VSVLSGPADSCLVIFVFFYSDTWPSYWPDLLGLRPTGWIEVGIMWGAHSHSRWSPWLGHEPKIFWFWAKGSSPWVIPLTKLLCFFPIDAPLYYIYCFSNFMPFSLVVVAEAGVAVAVVDAERHLLPTEITWIMNSMPTWHRPRPWMMNFWARA